MKRRLQIISLRLAIVAVRLPLVFAGGMTWQLEALHSRFQSTLQNLQAHELRQTR